MVPRPPRQKSSNNTLYFIVGALVIAVLIIGWFMYGGSDSAPPVDDHGRTARDTAGRASDTAGQPRPAPAGDTNVSGTARRRSLPNG